MRIRAAVIRDPRLLRKLLRRHPDKIVQLVVIVAVPSPQTWGNLKKWYQLEEVPWPVLLAESSGG